jgi:lipoprotein-releasing system ATP-binding protein
MSELLVEAVGVCRHFPTEAEDICVLRDLELRISMRDLIVITGASGSGKSTLLSILGGLDRFDSGTIRAGEWRLESLGERRLAEYRADFIGFVFQFHYLLRDFSAQENVALPCMMRGLSRKAAMGKAALLLSDLGLGSRLGHVPAQLSGGERQRTAIARALINSPPLVLADEPTGNLDSTNARSVRDLLFSLPQRFGTTVLVATHDVFLAAAAPTKYHLSEGKLESI